jgi:hypothetical protein
MLSRPFHNKYHDHDFSLLYDTIKRHYPIDASMRITAEKAANTPGFKKIIALVEENFLDKKNYRERWTKLNQFLKKEIKKPVRSTFTLYNCCYSGAIVLEEFKGEDFIKAKKLHFYISLLGPFFSIIGIDSATILLPIEMPRGDSMKDIFEKQHAVTVSPIFEYTSTFNLLEGKLREFFPGYSFIPYNVGMSTIKNISFKDDVHVSSKIDTVYEGLFGQIAIHDCLSRGDGRYGLNDWLKPFNKKEQKLIDLISEHIINPTKESSIHKVWKLQEYKRLDTFKITGNLMFGMDLFDVIDLCDKVKAIVRSSDRGTPFITKYKIQHDVIKFSANVSPDVSLRIVNVGQDSLTLNLIIDLTDKNASIKGETVEMKFVQMKKVHDVDFQKKDYRAGFI